MDQNMISAKQRLRCHKINILDLLLNKPKSLEWQISLLIFWNKQQEIVITYGSN